MLMAVQSGLALLLVALVLPGLVNVLTAISGVVGRIRICR